MLPSVTTILSDGGVGYDMSHLPEEYPLRGTFVHDVAYKYVMGIKTPDIPEKWKGYVEGLASYFCDTELETWAAECHYPEEPEEENDEEKTWEHDILGFQGHPDWVGIADRMHSIRDYKTGSIPEYAGAQLAGYELLARIRYPQVMVWDHTAIKLMKNGKYQLKTYTDAEKAEGMRKFMNAYYGFFESEGVQWTHRQ